MWIGRPELGKNGSLCVLVRVQGKALWLKYMGYETEEIEDYLGKKGGALRTAMSRGRSLLKSNPEILSIAEEVFGRSFSKVA